MSVVIPVFNEAENIGTLVSKVKGAMVELGRPFEILLVNDGSTDRTAVEIGRVAEADARVKAIHLRSNYGQTTALVAGFHHSEGGIIVTLDGDLQNDPQDIGTMLVKLEEGFDVVSGWRADRQDNAIKRNFPSLIANKLISRSTGVPLHDFGCSLKAYRREIIRHVHLYGEMHRFIAIYAVLSGARLAEIPVRHHPRLHGKSKYGLERTLKVVFDLLVVLFLQRYAQKPMYLFGTCGLLSLVAAGICGLGALYYKIWGGKSFIATPLPLTAGVLFLVAALCVLMGLLAELSIRIYHESQDKPTYLIASTDNLQARDDAI